MKTTFPRGIKIVSTGGTGRGTKVFRADDGSEIDLPLLVKITFDPITAHEPVRAHLTFDFVELVIASEVHNDEADAPAKP